MSNLARYTKTLEELDTFVVFDDFATETDTFRWTLTVTDSGTGTVSDAAGGIIALVCSDGSVGDNDEANLCSVNEYFLFAANKPIYGKARLQFTEANTDDANVAFGFCNAATANTLLDDGAGVKVSGSCAAIYKVDGGTVWKCVTSTNGVSTVSTSTKTAGGASYQVLEILIEDYSSTQMQATFKVDGQFLKDSNGLVIRHFVPIASATEMQVFAGAKNGSTNLETLNVDYIYASQLR